MAILLRGDAELLGLGAVHGDVEPRFVVNLLDVDIDRAGNLLELIRDLVGQRQVLGHVLADELDVDRRGQAEVEDLVDDIRGLEKELRAGKFARQIDAKLALIIGGRLVARIEGNQDVAIGRADDAGVRIGQVDAAVGKAEVVQDAAEILRGNVLADRRLDLVAKLGRFLDARAGLGPDVELELPGIDGRKKVLPEKGNQAHAAQAKREEDDGEEPAMFQRAIRANRYSLRARDESRLRSSGGIARRSQGFCRNLRRPVAALFHQDPRRDAAWLLSRYIASVGTSVRERM